MHTLNVFFISILLSFFIAANSMAAERINTLEKKGLFGYEPNGVAIRGYDTVAYFTQGRPVKGDDQISIEWEGATWRFSSQDNLDLFTAEPAKYAPQYGGYCAYGVAQGSLVKIEPDLWSIVDGKLYLNYNAKFNNKWKKDISGYIDAANEKFEALLQE